MLSETLPIEEAPVNGWTMTSADKYCGETLRSSSAASGCAHVPDIDVSSHVASCRGDLLHSGDSREATRSNCDVASDTYRVTMVVAHLGWVDLDLEYSTLLLGSR